MTAAHVRDDDAAGGDDRSAALMTLVHDIRQPLTAVGWLIGTVERGARITLGDRKRLHLAGQELEFMSTLLDETLAAKAARDGDERDAEADAEADAWADTGDAVAACPPIALADGLAACAVRLTDAGTACITLEIDGSPTVRVPATALRRVLDNLVDNAVRASGPGGHVTVTLTERGGEAVITVSDDGPGFGRITARNRLGLLGSASEVIAWGGSVVLGSGAQGGAQVTVRIPVAGHCDP